MNKNLLSDNESTKTWYPYNTWTSSERKNQNTNPCIQRTKLIFLPDSSLMTPSEWVNYQLQTTANKADKEWGQDRRRQKTERDQSKVGERMATLLDWRSSSIIIRQQENYKKVKKKKNLWIFSKETTNDRTP